MIPLAVLLLPVLVVAMARHEPLNVAVGLAFWGAFGWLVLAYLGAA
jgi:hypothetical protein